ncbi:hypothetical protein [Chryseobacterium sp. FH2]|uniref:hypothetical protein n=1 Tax=Chryseobacterium sp. FH2 TaxID=1674291 RepID=UPI0009E3F8C0|nr:hypothetical protein [Chryseobacterium sp. FH2]
MKKLIFLLFLSSIASAQVAIGKEQVDGSGILDFPVGTTNGIILPRVLDSETMTTAEPGTMVFDLTTSRVKYFNGAWTDLSDKTGNSPTLIAGNDITTSGVIIGASSSTASGVLVLESADKALILPKITDPVTNVKSPAAGMICYDPTTKLICVYNGTEWFFWK